MAKPFYRFQRYFKSQDLALNKIEKVENTRNLAFLSQSQSVSQDIRYAVICEETFGPKEARTVWRIEERAALTRPNRILSSVNFFGESEGIPVKTSFEIKSKQREPLFRLHSWLARDDPLTQGLHCSRYGHWVNGHSRAVTRPLTKRCLATIRSSPRCSKHPFNHFSFSFLIFHFPSGFVLLGRVDNQALFQVSGYLSGEMLGNLCRFPSFYCKKLEGILCKGCSNETCD